MNSWSEIRMRVVKGMTIIAFCINLNYKVSRMACFLPYSSFHSQRNTSESFEIWQLALVFYSRVCASHSTKSLVRKMKLELVVKTISFAEWIEI
jgi:hypothetical protein